MPPSAHLTRHARERIGDRLSMDDGDVVAILDYDLAVLVGTRAGRLHRLFFSPADKQCFVAIQDQENGDVVTTLPLDYQPSKAWEVSPEAQEEAEGLLLGVKRSAMQAAEPQDSEVSNVATTARELDGPRVFRVGCYVLTSDGQIRGRSVGSMHLARVGDDLSRVSEADDVPAEIRQRVAETLQPDEVLKSVFVRRRRGETLTIEDSRRWG